VIALHVDQSVKDAKDGYRYTAITAGAHKNDYSPHEPLSDAAKSEFTQLIQVSLAYRKIDWEHTVAGTSGSDDWRAPSEA